MSLSRDLNRHALFLYHSLDSAKPDQVVMRRAVSACYYRLFHLIAEDAALLIAPNVQNNVRNRIQRWFDHARLKEICGRFSKQKLDQPLLDLIGSTASESLQEVCRTFIQLQEARHSSDYDPGFELTSDQTLQYVRSAVSAEISWTLVKNSAEANIFILSLLLWKNWDRERSNQPPP